MPKQLPVQNWQTVWEWKQHALIEMQQLPVASKNPAPGEPHYIMNRVRIQDGIAGGVAIIRNRAGKFLLVRQQRPVVGLELWEFPRGMGEKTDVEKTDGAVREAREETGLPVAEPQYLGTIWPDSGILGNEVHVVAMLATSEDPISVPDGEIAELRWVTKVQLQELIASGEICDGITLSAWALWLAVTK